MKQINNRVGCCKYCKKADTCLLSYIFPLGELTLAKTLEENTAWPLINDIYAAVEAELYKKGIGCTASKDCCPQCKKHEDSDCYGEE